MTRYLLVVMFFRNTIEVKDFCHELDELER